MAKYFIVLFLALCALEFALCLECYATDVASLKTHGAPKNRKQDCREHLEHSMRLQGVNRSLPPNIVLKCYTVVVNTEVIDVTIKGCVPEGGCGLMKSVVKTRVETSSGVDVESVKCTECGSDNCNGDSPNSLN